MKNVPVFKITDSKFSFKKKRFDNFKNVKVEKVEESK